MARNAKTLSSAKRKGTAAKRRNSRQLLDDILALAGTFDFGRRYLGGGNTPSFSSATRSVTEGFAAMPSLRTQAAMAGDGLTGLAEYAIHTDIEQMVKDAGALVRRNPVAALAFVAATVLVVSRLGRPAAGRVRIGATARKSPAVNIVKSAGRKRKGSNGQAHA